jgi:hypothetical protein
MPSIALTQSNTVPGVDVKLGALSSLTAQGRTGTFPTGMNGLAMSTTACNMGTVDVPWLAAMQDNHPCIGFLVARERGTRMVQISNWSFVKHGFFALSNSQCSPCQHPSPNGTWLGVGCSDTYSISNNGDSFWLGPPSEIDPWLHMWNPVCSYFDKGDPAVAPPQDCDGIRSLTTGMVSAMGPVANRVHVSDADLNSSGSFYYQAQYVIRGEAETTRGDNLGSKRFTPSWNGNFWNITTNDANITYGSILNRWSGATVTSNTNGSDDGRLYVAVKVTGPTNGLYHYEYAIHNRDNSRGVGAFRMAIAPCTTITNVGFRDVDQDATNDWTFAQTASEFSFSTMGNPLHWNSIYNFFFDSNAAPLAGQGAVLDQFAPGAGAASVTVTTTGPAGLPTASYGIGTPGCNGAHHICGNSAPAIGNANFKLTCSNAPATSLGLCLVANAQDVSGSDPFQLGILLHLDLVLATDLQAMDFNSDAAGLGTANAPIPNNPNLVGNHYFGQAIWAWMAVQCTPSPFGLSSSDGLDIPITQ